MNSSNLKLSKKYSIVIFLIGFFLNIKLSNAQKYFDYDSVSPLAIEQPFTPFSKEHKNQIEQILLMQKNIEIEEIDKALEEKRLTPDTVVLNINKKLTRQKFPKLYHLLDRVGDTSRDVTEGFKNFWKIPRPSDVDKNVEILISPSKGYCYPSGHTTGAYIYAQVMSLLIPDLAEEYFDYANQVAWHRVQVGMHYPSDLQGGKQLAIYLIGGLMQNAEFQADLQEAKNELKKAKIIK
ncbi:MAG: phosphatase PAP2 family protein [Rickettsiales bacterium]